MGFPDISVCEDSKMRIEIKKAEGKKKNMWKQKKKYNYTYKEHYVKPQYTEISFLLEELRAA